MPRGRPKKNPSPIPESPESPESSNFEINDSDNPKPETQQPIPKNSYICSRCHTVVPYTLEHINMNRLTRIAPWHREMPEDIQICRSCCAELNILIESWYLESDMGKTKWQEKYKDI